MDAARNSQNDSDGRALVQNPDTPHNYLVSCRLDDSWSTLVAEAALIERWLGAEIAALFGD